MKHFYFVILLLFTAPSIAQNRNPLTTDSLEQFQSPSFPAGSILGIQANEISQPKSLEALKLSVLNNFLDSNNNFAMPDNYAIEISPFMLSRRKNFNYATYIDPNFKQNFWQNLSFSIAATNQFIINDTTKTNAFSFGFRTLLLNGHAYKDDADTYRKLLNSNDRYSADKARIMVQMAYYAMEQGDSFKLNFDSLSTYLNRELPDSVKTFLPEILASMRTDTVFQKTITTADLNTAFEAAFDQATDRDTRVQKAVTMTQTIRNERYGFRVELNGAMGLNFPTNEFEYSIIPRSGLWLTAGYTPRTKHQENGQKVVDGVSNFDFLCLARYIWTNDQFVRTYAPVDSSFSQVNDVFDIGFRINYKYQKFSAGAEGIYRQSLGDQSQNTYKLNLNLNYELRNNIILTYNFGKNYNSFGSQGDLVSTLSLNFGLMSLTYKDLKNAASKL